MFLKTRNINSSKCVLLKYNVSVHIMCGKWQMLAIDFHTTFFESLMILRISITIAGNSDFRNSVIIPKILLRIFINIISLKF